MKTRSRTESFLTTNHRASSRTRAIFHCIYLVFICTACNATASFGAQEPLLQAGLKSVNFGNVVVGSTASQAVTMTNNGAQSLTITAIQPSGPPFAVTGVVLPFTIAPGKSITYTVQFSPTATGLLNGTVTLTASKGNKMTESLSGTGITLLLTLTPASLSFGNTVLGESSSLSVLATNTGTAAVTISSDVMAGTGFTPANLILPLTLNPNQSTSFSVDFDPTTVGSFNGTVSLVSNATGSPTVETFSGTGIHAVSLTWIASASPGVTGYNIYRGTAPGTYPVELTSTPVAGTSFTDTTVAAGKTYYYVATAVAGSESSGYSNQAQATVPTP